MKTPRLVRLFTALLLATCAPAIATTLQIGVMEPSVANEFNRTAHLTWTADGGALYKIQCATNLASPSAWQTLDVVGTNATGPIRWMAPEAIRDTRFYRLVLPQPEIFSVEPAVVDVGVPNAPLYILGQSLPTNALVLINGQYFTPTIINTGGVWAVVSLNGLPPGIPWTGIAIVDAGTSNVIATLPNSVLGVDASSPYLLEPPELPPASPETGASSLTAAQCNYFETKDKVTICHATSSVRKPYTRINNPANSGDGDAIRENDNVTFDVQEGKKGLNAVNVKLARSSGEVQQQAVDLAVEGRGLDFDWTRTYRSRSTTNSSLGTRWTHSYDVNIQPVGGDIVIHDGTGRADRFFLQTNGTFTCPQFFREGTLTSGVFRLTFADTGYWQFNPTGGSPSAGKLALIVDRNGNTMSLNYDGAGRLTKVVDALGRTNSIGYNGSGQLTTVTDFSGRTVTYAYYSGEAGGSVGDLKSVTSPPVTGTPNGNDFPLGKKTTYAYTTGSLVEAENHLLTTIADADGTVIQSCSYNLTGASPSYLRCISLQRWTNPPTMFSYLPQTPTPANQFATLRCVENDPVGNVTECFFDARNRCVKLQEFTGRSTPGLAVTDTANRPTAKLRATDPNYFETRWSWNNDSLCTLEISPVGQQVQSVYESDFSKSTRARKRADLRVVREIASGGVDINGDGLADLTERVWRYEYDPRFGSEPIANGIRKGDLVSDTPPEKSPQTIPAPPPLGSWHGQCVGGFCTVATDPRGNVTTASYDAQGKVRLLIRRRNSQPQLDFAYNPQGQLTAITNAADANGRRRVDAFTYYTNGPQAGYLQACTTDAGVGGLMFDTYVNEYDARGNPTRHIDARGNDWLYTYNALDQCVRAQSPVNLTARCATDYFYDANDNLFAVSSQLRDETDMLVATPVSYLQHDPLHRVTEITLPVDATRALTNRFIYDGNDQCVLARGGDAVSGADPFQTTAIQYDERGLLYRTVDAPGSPVQSTSQCDYDSNGNPILVSEGLEGTPSTTALEYDGFAGFGADSPNIQGAARTKWRISATWPSRGQASPQNYQPGVKWKNIVLKRDYVGPSLCNWRSSSRVSRITDPMGNVTTFHYDANDNLKVTRLFGQTNDVPGSVGNLRLAESRYEYDGLDRPVVARDSFFTIATQAPIADGERTTLLAYAPNGQCTSLTDDLGRVTAYTYDTVGWPASESSPSGKKVYALFRDAAGNESSVNQTDLPDLGGPPQVFSRTNVFDSLNRCVSTTDNVGNTNRFAYDSFSRPVQATDPRGIRTFHSYDLLGRPTLAVRDLDGNGSSSLTLDITSASVWSSSSDQLLATTDSHGNTTSYGYDSLSRCTSITNADGTRHTFTWDARSNVAGEQDANGTVVSHAYDLNDRCATNSYTPGAGVSTATTFERFTYDGCSRLVSAVNNSATTSFAYDSLDHRTRDASGALATVSAFDSVGNPLALTYPGGRALTFTHDTQDRITGIVESSTTLAGFEYDGPGRVARVTYANGLRTLVTWAGLAGVPNAPGDSSWADVSSIRHETTAGSALVVRHACLRDPAGNTTSASTATPVPVLHTNTMTFGYDNADRLLNSIVTSNSALIGFATYGLDRMGNRTNVNRPLCAGNYSLDAFGPAFDFQMNQYSSTPCDARTYDANGNLANVMTGPFSGITYVFDCHDRLVSATDSTNFAALYAYDALGRRISKTVASGSLPPVTTTFLYDGSDVIEERVTGVTTATYVGPPCAPCPGSFLTMRRSGQDYFYHADTLGNTLALSTAGGTVVERCEYDDYGGVTFLTGGGVPTGATSSAVGNPYCWNGLRLDAETGLHNDDGGGYHDTQTGRSISEKGNNNPSGEPCLDSNDVNKGIYHGNNPWSGGGTLYSKGTIKIKGTAGSGGALYAKGTVKIKGGAGSLGGVAFLDTDHSDDDPYPISTGHDLPCPIITRPVLKGGLGRVYLVKTPRTVVQSSTINAKADSYDR